VATQALIIVTITMLGLDFPPLPGPDRADPVHGRPADYLPRRLGPPRKPDPQLLLNLARFVLPAAVLTAGCAVAVYTFLFTLVTRGFNDPNIRDNMIAEFEQYTDLTYGVDPGFIEAAATIGAQTGLSTFVSLIYILLLHFLAPPTRIFAAWTPPGTDKRPAALVVALLAGLLTALVVPALRDYFGLTRPGVVYATTLPVLLLWFLALAAAHRFRVMERLLGLPDLAEDSLVELDTTYAISGPAERPE
jgi:cation-transporting ATPase E